MARALYIHWPFCARKCPYCDFNSHVRTSIDDGIWRDALLADLRFEAEQVADRQPLSSVFFGGGTPSLMPPATAAALLEEAERLFGFEPDIEITLEANPSSVEAERFADLANAGVNRVSLGVQALDDAVLRFLGRLHSVDEALHALDHAQHRFDRVSFDLIYARPGQTKTEWEQELARALSFGTEHLSLYQLTIEPGTRFATDLRRGLLEPLNDDAAADLYELTQEMTGAAGLPAYEVSNHARSGCESRHNLTYWRYGDYLGIGPGAHGRRDGFATERHKKPENFLSVISSSGSGVSSVSRLSAREQASEALLMGLRLAEGVDISEIASRFGLQATDLRDDLAAARLVAQGLLSQMGDRVRVTGDGMLVLNSIVAELINIDLLAA